MDSFELNKIIGAILGTLLFVMGVGFLAEAIYHPIEGRGPGYALPEPEVAGEVTEAVVEEAVPLGVLLASANVEQGAVAARKCQACHNFEEGAGNKQGPELYDVVGRVIGSKEGFAYSEAMAAHREAGDVWSYEALDAFLTAPKAYIPDTKMNFAGVKNEVERANLLAYLGSLSASPEPFPPAEEAPLEAEADDAVDATPDLIDAAPDEAISTGAEAVETPTETRTDSPVVGTPISESEAGAPVEPAAQ